MKNTVVLLGFQAVTQVLRSQPERVLSLHLLEKRRDGRMQAIEALAAKSGVAVQAADHKALEQLAGDQRHQGVVAVCKPAAGVSEAELSDFVAGLEHDPLLLVLDGVTDPRNLGACLRSADGAGVDAVVVPRDRSAGSGPAMSRASAGASEVLPLVQVTNLARTLKLLQECGIWVSGAAGEADVSLYQADLRGPRAVVLGSEDRGMRRLTREQCDELVSIPMLGGVESLNVSVAAALCLYECRRQRGF